MPREQITYRKIQKVEQGEGQPAIEKETDTICTHVGWNRAGWVQVSLAMSRSVFNDLSKAWSDDPEVFIFSEVLEREDINKMIRTLRKARDQAYGQDA